MTVGGIIVRLALVAAGIWYAVDYGNENEFFGGKSETIVVESPESTVPSLPDEYWDEEDFRALFDQTRYTLGKVENGPGPGEILIRDALSAAEVAMILNSALARGEILMTRAIAYESATGAPLVRVNRDSLFAYEGGWITVKSGHENEFPRLSRACVEFVTEHLFGGFELYGIPEHRLPTLWEETAVAEGHVRGLADGYFWRYELAWDSMPLTAVLVRPINSEDE